MIFPKIVKLRTIGSIEPVKLAINEFDKLNEDIIKLFSKVSYWKHTFNFDYLCMILISIYSLLSSESSPNTVLGNVESNIKSLSF